MSEGYPDYARLTRSGGYELYNFSGNFNNNQFFYSGYVGNHAFVTIPLSMGAGTDYAQFNMAYYTDGTFTTQVGFRRFVRFAGQFSVVQYPNLSEWLQMSVQTASGNPIPVAFMGMYGTDEWAPQFNLTSTDVPLLTYNANIAASTTMTFSPLHAEPGDAVLSFFTTAATWNVAIQCYQWSTASFIQLTRYPNGAFSYPRFDVDLPMLDLPYQIAVTNSDTAAKNFNVTIVSKP